MYIKVVYNNGDTEYYSQEAYLGRAMVMSEEEKLNHTSQMVFEVPAKTAVINLDSDGSTVLEVIWWSLNVTQTIVKSLKV